MTAASEQRQFLRMTRTPIPRLIGGLAVPTICSMLIGALYNLADTFFVARLGTSAAGAVGIVFAMTAIVQAVGFMIGMGAGSLISRALGRRDKTAADTYASTAFAAAAAAGVLLAAAGLLFTDRLLHLLGATATILPYAREYARCIFFGVPLLCCSFVMNNILRAEGRAVLSMVGLGFGGLLNIALDPLFIFTWRLGIAGAAMATLICQAISFGILLTFFLTGRSISTLAFRHVARCGRTYLEIARNGLPSFCRQSLASIATVALNVAAAAYGDAAVAAMSIVGRCFFLILAAMLGFGQGFQPVVGYNYGAGRYDRVREAFAFCLKTGTAVLSVLAVVGFIFAPEIIAQFRSGDPQVVVIGALALRAQCLVLPIQPLIVITNMLFQSLGKSAAATLISACRQGLCFLPLIVILPHCFGLAGVQFTQTGADLLTAGCCLPFLHIFFRRLPRFNAASASAETVRPDADGASAPDCRFPAP